MTALPGKDQETERSAVDLKVNGVRKEKERLTADALFFTDFFLFLLQNECFSLGITVWLLPSFTVDYVSLEIAFKHYSSFHFSFTYLIEFARDYERKIAAAAVDYLSHFSSKKA